MTNTKTKSRARVEAARLVDRLERCERRAAAADPGHRLVASIPSPGEGREGLVAGLARAGRVERARVARRLAAVESVLADAKEQ